MKGPGHVSGAQNFLEKRHPVGPLILICLTANDAKSRHFLSLIKFGGIAENYNGRVAHWNGDAHNFPSGYVMVRRFQIMVQASRSNAAVISQARRGAALAKRQNGSVAVMFAVLVIPMIGICGLAIDLGMVYSRKTEMRNLAQAVAISAAKKLDGTSAGITAAMTAAENTAAMFHYQNNLASVTWSPAALQFGTTPEQAGTWADGGTASSSASRIFYVKVDTSKLDDAGVVKPVLMPILSSAFSSVTLSDQIIAGRVSIEVAPLAICAMSNVAGAPRTNSASFVELVEYGFRRGISYDLMNLNPTGTTALNFIVNPAATPGTTGSSGDLTAANVSTYACAGTLGIPRITGDPISVARPFPLASLYQQLNSRFDQYGSATCTANGGPPDVNVKQYTYTNMPAVIPWMTTAPSGQVAESIIDHGKLMTVADVPPPSGTAGKYGPLWAYAKAVPFSAYVAGTPEPTAGYATFTTASWSTLYAGQTVKTYPSGTATPYKAGVGVNFQAPSAAHGPGLQDRRVLNVPLLDCSTAPSGSATVLAVGRFFMTVPATPTVLAAEFAGTIPTKRLDGSIRTFQ